MSDDIKPIFFSELEMAEDLKEYIKKSSDVKISEDLKYEINKQEDKSILVVDKKIGSPIEILKIKLYDNTAVEEIFTSLKS
jgi:hypothetical protein